ncbi:two-component sensor histidine kinase [Desulfomarina profundi]|uniref:histidine kinase n=1 Tax=Desulfomarina profundi TaxID=2772557 RepID=A0A8D5FSL5_9BACT|nr:ATP-binding protein [Desulfomarina profundi]BCL60641.1 two-component sensor histidine kinase [Desulfomarina profundi]
MKKKEKRTKDAFKDFLYALSPWVLGAACILLFFVLTLFTVNSYRREKQLVLEALTQRGITVMRFIASYGRERMRETLQKGASPGTWEEYVQSALQQAVEQPGIDCVVLFDGDNKIIAAEGEEKFFPGEKVDVETIRFLEQLKEGDRTLIVSEKLITARDGEKYFQLAARFKPLGFAGRFRLMGLMEDGNKRMMGGHHRPFSKFRSEVDRLFSMKPVLLVRLEPKEFSTPLRNQIIQMLILLVVFILVAVGGFLSLLTLRGLKDSQKELRRSERLAALGRMAAGVAHELRNPLSSIKGLAMLMKSGEKKGSGAIDETADLLVGEVDRLNRGIEELLDYAKPDRLRISKANINGIIRKTSSLLAVDLDSQNIQLDLQLGSDIPDISADEDKLNRLLLNLSLNAVQAMEMGGTLKISTRREGKNIIITVADNGPGITEDHMKKVFDPYFTTKSAGTGLGLAMCSKIVEEHCGEISISSTGNEGTVVVVKLPV